MIQDPALNGAVCRPSCPAPDERELAQVRLIALNLACEAVAAPGDATLMRDMAARAAAIEALLQQVRRRR